jgi:hypothetical protein
VQGATGADVFLSLYGLDADVEAFVVEVLPGAQCDATNSCIGHSDAYSSAEPEALAFTAAAGRDYFVIVDGPQAANFNIALHCSTSSNCRPARAIQAGQTIVASNALGQPNVTDNQLSYSCSAQGREEPEASFMFTPVVAGTYRIDVTGLTTNLDLFILDAPNCNGTCSGAATCASSPASGDETCTLIAQAHKSYFIVIDGYGISTFTLSVTAL